MKLSRVGVDLTKCVSVAWCQSSRKDGLETAPVTRPVAARVDG